MTPSEALAFFNKLSGRLQIELTEAAKPVSEQLSNLVASPTARIASLKISWSVYEDRSFRDLTAEEWDAIALEAPSLQVRAREGLVIDHAAPDGKAFTVRDLAAVVEATERQGRDDPSWLGGVDVHHVFFEGMRRREDGAWKISWGS